MALLGIPSGSVIAPARLAHDDARLGRDPRAADRARAGAALDGAPSFPALLVIVFLLGVFIAPYITRSGTIIPELFGDDERPSRRRPALFGGATPAADRDRPRDRGRAVAALGAPAVLVIDGVHVPLRVRVHRAARRRRAAASRRTTTRAASSPASATSRRDRLLGPMTLALIILDGAARRDRCRRAAGRVHALRRQRARRRLALHELRRRRGDRLGARDRSCSTASSRCSSRASPRCAARRCRSG